MTPPVSTRFGNYQQQQCATTLQHSRNQYEYWTCKGCSQWHWVSQKKCGTCGMKKTWAEAVAPKLWTPPSTQKQDRTSTEWEEFKDWKRSQPSPKILNAVNTSVNTPWPHRAQGAETSQTMQDGQSAREKLAEELNTINEALRLLPDSLVLQETRFELTTRQEQLKKQISATRPLASRLDSCIAAVERAKKRLNQATQEEDAARCAWEDLCKSKAAAEEDLESKERELAALRESAIADGTCSSLSPNQPGGNSIKELENNMAHILGEMQHGGRASQHRIEEAMSMMSTLFQHLQDVARECKDQEEVRSEASTAQMLTGPNIHGAAAPASISGAKRPAEMKVQQLDAIMAQECAAAADPFEVRMHEAALALGTCG